MSGRGTYRDLFWASATTWHGALTIRALLAEAAVRFAAWRSKPQQKIIWLQMWAGDPGRHPRAVEEVSKITRRQLVGLATSTRLCGGFGANRPAAQERTQARRGMQRR